MLKQKIFFWYIFKELLSPFALGLFIFTFVLLMNRILKLMDMIINKGIGIGEVFSLIAFLLPSFLVLTIPMAILLAILIVLGKFSADSEIIAMKASGISLYQIIPPFAALCVFGFFVTNFFTLYLLPKGNNAFRSHVFELAQKHAEANLEEGVFNDFGEKMVVYIDKFNRDEKTISGILISDNQDPNIPTLISAEHGLILSGKENLNLIFRLFNGSIHRLERKSMSYQYALFQTYEMNIKLSGTDEERRVKYKEMSLGELIKLAAQKKKIKRRSSSLIKMNVEIHKRFAFPFACIVFGILGLSLGVYWRRGGKSYGFVFSLLIVFLYYFFLNFGETLAKRGIIFAFMGIWLPNVVLGFLGIYLFKRVAREQPLPFLEAGSDFFLPFIEKIKSLKLKIKN